MEGHGELAITVYVCYIPIIQAIVAVEGGA